MVKNVSLAIEQFSLAHQKVMHLALVRQTTELKKLVKQKPVVTHSDTFSHASCQLQAFTLRLYRIVCVLRDWLKL